MGGVSFAGTIVVVLCCL